MQVASVSGKLSMYLTYRAYYLQEGTEAYLRCVCVCLSDLQELKSELLPFSPCVHPVCGLHASGGTGWQPCTNEDCQSIPMVIALPSGKCLRYTCSSVYSNI